MSYKAKGIMTVSKRDCECTACQKTISKGDPVYIDKSTSPTTVLCPGCKKKIKNEADHE